MDLIGLNLMMMGTEKRSLISNNGELLSGVALKMLFTDVMI